MNAAARAAHDRTAQVWAVLATVPDPEVPVISLCELGIVREVLDHGRSLEVVLTPTYSGCPATEFIEHTERLSAFGATACKALWRCLDCREPFEHFKPL